jgi:ribosomal protein L40E
MIVCPNCNHQNPEGAQACEACYTPLPATTNCPNCGATVQTDATFCGQCGHNLQPSTTESEGEEKATATEVPATEVSSSTATSNEESEQPEQPEPVAQAEATSEVGNSPESATSIPIAPTPVAAAPSPAPVSSPSSTTQLQVQTAGLLHVQTNSTIELPQHLDVIHLGKPNDMIPPDIDVSGFPNSEIVSRIHADIRAEADAFYIEDVGSSNGTYINNLPLPKGNRHRLRPGDRIALGKGDMMTFLFQLS